MGAGVAGEQHDATPLRKLAATPAPAIVCARFELNGKVLATYDAATLAEFAPPQQ